MSRWSFYRGETIAIPYIVAGDLVTVLSATADLKPIAPSGAISPDTPVVASMSLVALDGLAGWWVGLSAGQCAALAPGRYGTQVRMVLTDGKVDLSDILIFTILEPVTEA